MAHNVVHTAIEGLLALFYISVLFTIISSKTKILKNAFYTLFVATGIVDVISLCTCCFIRLNRELGLGEEFQLIMRWCLILSGAGAFAHFIGNLLITVNRYSTICLLNKYDWIWTRKRVFVMVTVQYFISIVAFLHISQAKMVYIHYEDGKATYNGFEKSSDIISSTIHFVGSLIYAVVSGCLNVRLVVEWRRWPKNGRLLKHRHKDKGLLLYTVLVFSCTTLMCAQSILRAVALFLDMKTLKTWISMQYFWTNDVLVSIPPFFLLLFSSNLRKEMVDRICRKSEQDSSRMFVVKPSSRRFVVSKF